MLVSLIKKDRIYSLTLPLAINGSYWVSDLDRHGNERKLVGIEEKDGKWVLRSNQENKIIEEDRMIPEVTLQDYTFHYLQIEQEEIALLYCAPVYDPNFVQLKVRPGAQILIGKNPMCKIIYNLPTVSEQHARIVYNNGLWQIEDLNTKFGTYVNNDRLIGTRILTHGDIIFITG